MKLGFLASHRGLECEHAFLVETLARIVSGALTLP